MSAPVPPHPRSPRLSRVVPTARLATQGPPGATSPPLFAASEGVWPKLLLGLLMALLFYLPNQAQLPFETGVRALNVANLLFVATLLVARLTHRTPDAPAPLKWPLLLFFLTLTWSLAIALARDSTAWVADLTVYKNAVFYPLLFFLYFYAVRDLATVRILLLLTLFVVLTSGILGWRQAMDYGLATFNENKRVAAPFGWHLSDANRAAVFFCILLQPVAAVALFLKSRGWLRLACAGVFALGVFVVFHTYSRQAYGILAATLLLITLRKHLVLALLAMVALYHYTLWVPETVVQRIEMTTIDPFEASTPRLPDPPFDPLAAMERPLERQLQEAESDSKRAGAETGLPASESEPRYDGSTESRFTLWSGAGELIQQQPLGVGMNRFTREMAPYVPADLRGLDAHNYYVLLTAEAGVLAPVFLAFLLVALLLLGWRLSQIPGDDEAHALGVGFVMATIAVAMGNLYGSRFVEGDVMGNYWIVAALVARTIQIKERQRLAPQQALPGTKAAVHGVPARAHLARRATSLTPSDRRPIVGEARQRRG